MTLKKLLGGDEPAGRLVRGQVIKEVIYGFGNASGLGFDSSWTETEKFLGEYWVGYRVGVWSEEVCTCRKGVIKLSRDG